MGIGAWGMGNRESGKRGIGNGAWGIGNRGSGKWGIGHGAWGIGKMGNSAWGIGKVIELNFVFYDNIVDLKCWVLIGRLHRNMFHKFNNNCICKITLPFPK